MTLKYPNQRLELYDRLVSQGNCISAFEETARSCGLNCPVDLPRARKEHESGACGSLSAAREVLEETMPESAEVYWQQLTSNVEQYKLLSGKKHCRGVDLQPSVIDCSRMAPVVMDYLLQLMAMHEMNSKDAEGTD